MNFLRRKFEGSPDYARVAPFVIFVVLTTLQGQLGEDSRYWLYLLKTLVGAWLIWEMRPFVEEMRWKVSWEALVVGAGIFGIWVGLDGLYPRLSEADAVWNPGKRYGEGSALAWLFVVVRIAGSTIVVPPLEEVFYRSYLYRVFVKTDFRAMPLGQFHCAVVCGHLGDLRAHAPGPVAGGHLVRAGISVAGDSQEPARRRNDRPRAHQFPARALGGLEGRLELLVERWRMLTAGGGNVC